MVPIRAKSVLIRRSRLDGWFLSRAGMNLYRGCSHDCIYCDGRSEAYRVEGNFGRDVVYKENAVDILTRELDPRRRRKPFRSGYVFIGGGVSDSWQPAEESIRLTRRVLELFRVFPYPLLVLTKSKLILRDFDLLTALNETHRVTVCVSLSTVDETLASVLEPGASSAAERLDIVRNAVNAGLGAGVMFLPVVPMITDAPAQLEAVHKASKDAGAQFLCPGPMTLKSGRQKDHFMKVAESRYPEAADAYGTVYGPVPDRWGVPSPAYFEYLGPLLHEIGKRHGLPRRIPAGLFPGGITPADRASVILDQMDGMMRDRGLTSSYGRAARSLSRLDVPLDSSEGWNHLRRLGGVGPATERLIKEILDTGTAAVYERILLGGNPSG